MTLDANIVVAEQFYLTDRKDTDLWGTVYSFFCKHVPQWPARTNYEPVADQHTRASSMGKQRRESPNKHERNPLYHFKTHITRL